MPEGQKRFVWNARYGVAATAVAAVVLAGIYVTLAGQGNGGVDAACAAAKADAAALDPLVGGEVAAFQLAREPEKLSGLAFTGTDGKPKTLAAFGGKVALVNLWATWCGPCRKEMPALDRLQAALGGDDFAVVPISIDIGDPERPKAFLEQIGVKNLPLYTDRTTKIFEDVKARGLAIGLPVTFLLDRNGCRLGHINGPAEWDSEDGRRLIEAAIRGGPNSEGI
jgi:thiol-disulfide isomerase/thioredoxin